MAPGGFDQNRAPALPVVEGHLLRGLQERIARSIAAIAVEVLGKNHELGFLIRGQVDPTDGFGEFVIKRWKVAITEGNDR